MAELAERLGFDLPDTLARYLELLTYFLKRSLSAVDKTESQYDHALLALGQCVEYFADRLLEHAVACLVSRRGSVLVGNEVAEVAVLLLADRGLK